MRRKTTSEIFDVSRLSAFLLWTLTIDFVSINIKKNSKRAVKNGLWDRPTVLCRRPSARQARHGPKLAPRAEDPVPCTVSSESASVDHRATRRHSLVTGKSKNSSC